MGVFQSHHFPSRSLFGELEGRRNFFLISAGRTYMCTIGEIVGIQKVSIRRWVGVKRA